MLKHRSIIVVTIALVIAASGCGDNAKRKQQVKAKWLHDKARTNIPVAQSQLQNGNIDQAQQTLADVLKDAPDLPKANLLMGQIYFSRDRIDVAKESFNKVVKFQEDNDQAWYWLGETAIRQKQIPQAIEHYTQALELKPSDSAYISALSNAYVESGEYDKALELINDKVNAFPGNTSLVLTKADILIRCDKKDQVSKTYLSGLLLNSNSPELIEGLGYSYLVDKNWSGAIEMFEKLLETASKHKKDEYLKILSTSSMNAGQYSRAIGYLDKVNSGYKDDPQYWFESGQAALGAGQAKRAVFCGERVMFLRPGLPEGAILLGSALYLEGDYTNALKAFEQVTTNSETAEFAWMMTGRCYKKLGQEDKARFAFEKAADVSGDTELVSLIDNTDK